MTSSTSSSDPASAEKPRASEGPEGRFHPDPGGVQVWLPDGPDLPGDPAHRDPAAWSLLLLAIMTVLVVVFRDDPRPADAPDWFFMQKLEWEGDLATVVAGDSRVYRGVVPGELASQLPAPIGNFGFSSAKYDREYLDRIRSTLDDAAPHRVVLLGITPFAFTTREAGFKDAVARNEARRVPLWWMRSVDLDHALAPIDPSIFVPMVGRKSVDRASAGEYRQVFHRDGWVESDREVEDPHRAWREGLPPLAAAYETDPARIEALLDAVGRWTGEGIVVGAFRPPVPEQTDVLESTLWGVDFPSLRAAIESAGGHWLDGGDPSTYRIYDGSHLDAESARRFTREIGDELAGSMGPR